MSRNVNVMHVELLLSVAPYTILLHCHKKVDDWRDIALPKDHTKPSRVRLLGANSVVTGFGNEYEAMGPNDGFSRLR